MSNILELDGALQYAALAQLQSGVANGFITNEKKDAEMKAAMEGCTNSTSPAVKALGEAVAQILKQGGQEGATAVPGNDSDGDSTMGVGGGMEADGGSSGGGGGGGGAAVHAPLPRPPSAQPPSGGEVSGASATAAAAAAGGGGSSSSGGGGGPAGGSGDEDDEDEDEEDRNTRRDTLRLRGDPTQHITQWRVTPEEKQFYVEMLDAIGLTEYTYVVSELAPQHALSSEENWAFVHPLPTFVPNICCNVVVISLHSCFARIYFQ